MKRNLILGVIILLALAAGGFWLYDWVLGEPLAASAPIAATPVIVEATKSPATPTVTATSVVEPTAPLSTPTEASEAADDPSEGLVVLAIIPQESEARFIIYELLNGQDKNVVGATNQVAGEVAINPDNLSQVQFGVIQINARTLVTDDSRRNNAIRNRILNTDQYEFITFTPTSISGLSGAGEVGKSYTVQITGDLTIRNVTQSVTFEATLTAESESRLRGSANATIKRSDFDLIVPSVPFVANVADEVRLELDFVMAPVGR